MTVKRSARNCALNLLARREHSQVELSRKLKERGFETEEIDIAMEKLQKEGLQSDERFTVAYVNMRARRGFGPVRIGQELQKRGIDDQMASRYMDGIDWEVHICAVWQKKFRGKKPAEFTEKAKQMAFLQYRGFEPDHIKHLFGE